MTCDIENYKDSAMLMWIRGTEKSRTRKGVILGIPFRVYTEVLRVGGNRSLREASQMK